MTKIYCKMHSSASWYKNALDFSSGGSFVLASTEENSTVIKNLLRRKIEEDEELEDMCTILTYLKKSFENCVKRLPDKRNLDHLELFSKHVILEMEDKMSLISSQLNSCEGEFKKEDKKTIRAEKKFNALGMSLS
jgi:hypothetical protein